MVEQNEPLRTSDLAGGGDTGGRTMGTEPPSGTATATPPGPDIEAGSEWGAPEGNEHPSDQVELLADGESRDYRARWEAVQTGFVDEPRAAVQQADALVAELMQDLARRFAAERSTLEAQWTRGGEAGTEELRLALQRYRSFFQRLLER